MESIGSENQPTSDPTDNKTKKRSHVSIYYFIQMFISFAQNLSFQYLPIYNRKLGATETQMGLLTSVQNVFSTFFSPFWGRRSDATGRKSFLLVGGMIAFGSAIAMAVAQTPNQIIFAVGVNAFGLSILIPTWAGAIADYTEGRKRGGFIGRLLGMAYFYITIALILYALISPYLPISEISQYRLIIWISAINFGFVVICSWIFIDLRSPKKDTQKESLFTPLKDKNYRKFLFIVLVWWFFMSLAWSYFPIVISDIVRATPAEVAWIGITATVVQAIVSFYLGDLIDKIGARKSLIIGFLPFSLVPFLFAFATRWYHLIPAQIIAGLGIGFGFTALQTYVLEIAGDDRAGNYMGSYNILWGLLTFVGSFLGGFFLDWFRDYTGSLQEALTIALIGIGIMRLLTNILMILFLPSPESKFS